MNIQDEQGTRIAAFFDLDGTLIPKPSLEWRFFAELRRHCKIPLTNYFRWGVQAVRLLPKGLLAVRHGNKAYLSGLNCDLVLWHTRSIAFFDEGISHVVWHAREGHKIVLLSGTLQELARLAALALECELEIRGVPVPIQICATRLAISRGEWTGCLDSEVLYGQAKAHLIENLAKNQRINLPQSYGYGNDFEDRYFLCALGRARAVNPRSELATLAHRKNWPICAWRHQKTAESQRNVPWPPRIQHMEKRA